MFQTVQVVPRLHQCLGTLDFLTPMQNVAVSSLMRCRGRGQPCANIYCRPCPAVYTFKKCFCACGKTSFQLAKLILFVHTALLVPSAEIAEMPAFVLAGNPMQYHPARATGHRDAPNIRNQSCSSIESIVLLCLNSES